MITINLDEYSVDDVRSIQELQALGIPDEKIQKLYDAVCQRRKGEGDV